MFVIKYRWAFIIISLVMVVASYVAIGAYGLNWGMDFKGGSILEVEYATSTRPTVAVAQTTLTPLNLGAVSLQSIGERGLILRANPLSESEHQKILTAFATLGKFEEKRFSTVGPTLGQELAKKGAVAIAIVVLLIIAYIAFAFRSVSRPVSSWKYGVVAILALIHDISVPTGIFAILGHFRGVEIDALFLTALLTILALSVNDTIVVFDRIRENLRRKAAATFAETVGKSLNETFVRSLNTSLTVIFALAALLLFGSESTRYFALALMIGMVVGTYSSIFIASPLLVMWHNWQEKKK
jgi:preprotein translocase subunit SecF